MKVIYLSLAVMLAVCVGLSLYQNAKTPLRRVPAAAIVLCAFAAVCFAVAAVGAHG